MNLHKHLLRQLLKHKLSEEEPPKNSKEWKAFLKVISDSYAHAEEDRYLMERSLEISSREVKDWVDKNKTLTLELAQASKLASLGTLASGIAHELNNPLQIISGFADLLSMKKDDPKFVLEKSKSISEVSKRMASTISYLLKLSHKDPEDSKENINLNEIVRESTAIVRKRLQLSSIELNVELYKEDLPIIGNAGAIASLIHNLISNSQDAFDENKSLDINRVIKVWFGKSVDGKNVIVHFQDNAGGIPENIIDQVFDPFFTTKETGKGTGLGLSISKQTVERFGGQMGVKVANGCTLFEIIFPLVDTEDAFQSISSAKKVEYERGVNPSLVGKKVLVVDDEPDICGVISLNLDQKKLKVKSTCSPHEALEILDQSLFDIVITDLKMPRISGFEVAEKVKKVAPSCKIIMLSGHIDEKEFIKNGYSSNGDCRFIKKPISSELLFKQIEELLAS